MNSKIEGVGALNEAGKIAEYSNITGQNGTDLLIKNPLFGKSIEQIENEISNINAAIESIQNDRTELLKMISEAHNSGQQQKLKNLIIKYKETFSEQKKYREQLYDYQMNKSDIYLINNNKLGEISGTSFSTPIRAVKLALNDMMEGIL